jgi:predicted P-loop ATPase
MTPDPIKRTLAATVSTGCAFEAEQIALAKDPAAAFRPDFVTQCALLTPEEFFDVRSVLARAFDKDFGSRGEWTRRVRAAQADLDPVRCLPAWTQHLILKQNGSPKALLENARVALQCAPEFGDLLAYDDFRLRVKALRAAPWGGSDNGWLWNEHDDRMTACWLQRNGVEVSTETAGEAVQMIALQRRVHEVRDFLESLSWDGKERVDTWLFDYLSAGTAADSQERANYIAAAGRCWLISAVARAYKPGCKVDQVPILEGEQGIGKSRACRALAGEWFRDSLPSDLNGKDAALHLAGAWIIELSELDSLSRSERTTIKAFLSRDTDSYRPPYGRRTEDAPRGCVFIGTTNSDSYLRDESGNRRFWPIRCGNTIDVEKLQRERDWLWAEAVALYKGGALWWLLDDATIASANQEQSTRFDSDPWQARIEDKASAYESLTVDQVLREFLDMPIAAWNQSAKSRVAHILRAMGWKRRQIRSGDKRPWIYERGTA